MEKYSRRITSQKIVNKNPIKISRQIIRSWGLATRLEHRNVKGKKSSK